MRIYDSQGKLLWDQYLENKFSFYQELDLTGFLSGMYMLHVHDGVLNKSYRFQIIIPVFGIFQLL
jgi:hypothetical protein